PVVRPGGEVNLSASVDRAALDLACRVGGGRGSGAASGDGRDTVPSSGHGGPCSAALGGVEPDDVGPPLEAHLDVETHEAVSCLVPVGRVDGGGGEEPVGGVVGDRVGVGAPGGTVEVPDGVKYVGKG